MLAEIKTVDDAKKIVNLAEAARVYAREVELGLEAQDHAAEIKLRAQRRGGEILAKMEKGAGRPSNNSIQPDKNYKTEQYKEIGITTADASRWQQIAALPAKQFEAVIADTMEADKELTTAAMLREAQSVKRETHHDSLKQAELPSNKYRVLYADPPWQYNDAGVITDSDAYGRAERHYPTLSIDALCMLGASVREMSESDAVLFLWVTSPLLEDSFKIINAWGFEYKTSFVWDKIKHNFGHYNSVRHEFLLICTRGSCTPDNLKLFDSVQAIERSDKHSEKPQEFYGIIETLYTHGKRLELFARSSREGWDSWGNE
jgi:N6-adenosine-specific RNA methylase IME4